MIGGDVPADQFRLRRSPRPDSALTPERQYLRDLQTPFYPNDQHCLAIAKGLRTRSATMAEVDRPTLKQRRTLLLLHLAPVHLAPRVGASCAAPERSHDAPFSTSHVAALEEVWKGGWGMGSETESRWGATRPVEPRMPYSPSLRRGGTGPPDFPKKHILCAEKYKHMTTLITDAWDQIPILHVHRGAVRETLLKAEFGKRTFIVKLTIMQLLGAMT